MTGYRTLRALCVAAALLALPAAARAQDPRLTRRLDPETSAAVSALVDSARVARLPTEPLVSKALEGASKRAPGALIVRAVRTLAGELRQARDVLGPRASDAELDAGASALHVGVRPEALARLRESRAPQPLTVALGVLTDLVARGVPADTATGAVLRLAGMARDDQLLAMQQDIERDIALGAPPAAAMTVRVNRTASEAFTSIGSDRTGSQQPPRRRRP